MDRQSLLTCGILKALVVGQENSEIGANRERCGKVDCVERAKFSRIKIAGSVQERFIEPYQSHCAEEPPSRAYAAVVPGPSQRPNGLRAEERGRGPFGPSREESSERCRFGLHDDQLHERGGVEVCRPTVHRLAIPRAPATAVDDRPQQSAGGPVRP